MAAYPGQSLRALRDLRRRVVRATRAEIRCSCRSCDVDDPRIQRKQLFRPRCKVQIREYAIQAPRNDRSQQTWRQLSDPGDQALTVLVVLADHPFRLVTRIVIKVLLELALDDSTLFLDHEDLAFIPHKFQRVMVRKRPNHADLVDIDSETSAFGFVQPQKLKSLH